MKPNINKTNSKKPIIGNELKVAFASKNYTIE